MTVDDVQSIFPAEFGQFYPRKYAGVGGWTSPRLPAAFFAMSKLQGYLTDDMRQIMVRNEIVADTLSSLLMPTYWVGREMVQAAENTLPPEDLCVDDLMMPLSAMIFLLPEGTLIGDHGEDSSWIAVARVPELVVLTSNIQRVTIALQVSPGSSLSCHEGGNIETEVTEKYGADAGIFARKMMRLAITFVMLMSARPQLVETATPHDATIPTTGKASRKLCAPNWIGRTYRVHREESLGGTHASPYLHWRRGHWRHQAHGPGRSLRRDILIDPILVGGAG
jgi:hypothetical protein